MATGLNNLAWALMARGAHDEAQPLFERALKINENAFGLENPKLVPYLRSLASVFEAQGQYERAGRVMERCLDIIETQVRRGQAGLMPFERVALSRSLRFHLQAWLDLVPHLGRPGLAAVLRFKGSLARAAAAERGLARRGGGEFVASAHALRASEGRLAKLANAPPSFRDEKKKAAWQKAYAKAAAEREELALALQRDFDPQGQGLERFELGLPDIQALLRKDAVLLDFLRSGDHYIAWIVRPEGEPQRIDLGKAAVIEEATASCTEATAAPDDSEWRKTGTALRDLVFAPIADLTPVRIRQALDRVASGGAAPQTVNGYRLAMSGFFGWLVREGRWPANPVKQVAPVRVTSKTRERRALTEDEVRRLLRAAPAHRALAYRLAVTTGLRRGELAALTWSDVDLDAATLRVRASTSKNRREATQPLPEGTVAALRAAHGERGLSVARVLRSVPGTPTLRTDLQAAKIEYETGEGVADFHALRATYATLLARAGVGLAQAQRLMRHSTPALTANVYTRLRLDDGHAAVARIDLGPRGQRATTGSSDSGALTPSIPG